MKKYVLGIDGGGTRTRAAIMDNEGNILGICIGNTSNYDDIGIDAARENIKQVVNCARQKADISINQFNAVFLGIGGVSSESDREIVKNMALDLHLAPEKYIGVDHDIRIALAGGLSGRPGIVQIAGTGSSCYGRNSEGCSWRSGGWGPLLSDEGSGYWLGIQAMKAATSAADGRSQPTVLLSSVLNYLNLTDINFIMHRVYVQKMTRSEIAALSPLVINTAKEGDKISLEIINIGIQSMAECISVVANKLSLFDKCELSLTGGVFQAGDFIIDRLRCAVHERIPHCKVTMAELPPAIGSCLLAMKSLGIQLTPAEIKLLQKNTKLLL
ncbi:MAG: N-acetylglucosamine kinase [Anaerolineaceae bacterium]